MNTTYMQIDYDGLFIRQLDAQDERQLDKQKRMRIIGCSKDSEDAKESHREKPCKVKHMSIRDMEQEE